MTDLGVRLQLLIGPTVPLPAPYAVIDSLREVEVTNGGGDRDGFQLTFAIGKDSLIDYSLLLSGLLDPPNRVIVMVFVNMIPQVLIDGLITSHQLAPSDRPGDSRLVLTGEDISLQMDLEEKSAAFANRPDFLIVTEILKDYIVYGMIPEITPTTDFPIELDRVPCQQGTDLEYIRELAENNGFVFYIETTPVPGVTTAYWGPDNRLGLPQSALTLNMGSQTNVDQSLNFSFDALGPVQPEVSIVDPVFGLRIPVPLPTSLHPPLARSPAPALRKTLPRDTGNLNLAQASLKAISASTDSSDAIQATGELDTTRYGGVLKARSLVGVRGVGQGYDGFYYVKQVTHRIKKGQYKQRFTLVREGLGTLTPLVLP